MEDNNFVGGTGLIKGTISGQVTIIDGWDDSWESDDIDENPMDAELIK